MRPSEHAIGDLETALLRRGVDQRTAGRVKCRRCARTPLVGEKVHVYEHGEVLCELCKALRPDAPVESQMIRGPELGHSIRITDRRAA
jgi:hypothetical protein